MIYIHIRWLQIGNKEKAFKLNWKSEKAEMLSATANPLGGESEK